MWTKNNPRTGLWETLFYNISVRNLKMNYLSIFFGDLFLMERKWRPIVTFDPTLDDLQDGVEDQDRVLDHQDQSVCRVRIHVQRIDPQLTDLKINYIIS
jgi:hypothetical protein